MNKKQLIVILLAVGAFGYTGYQVSKLSDRLQRIVLN